MQVRPILPLLVLCTVALDPPPQSWPEFRDEEMGVTFRHPATPGLRFDARAPTCAPHEAGTVPLATDSTVVVTRAVAPLPVLAANSAFARTGTLWQAEGGGEQPARAVTIAVNGWHAVLAVDAHTLVFDLELRQPVSRTQWRLVAVGPGECPAVLMGIATALPGAWDSAAVAGVLASARTRP